MGGVIGNIVHSESGFAQLRNEFPGSFFEIKQWNIQLFGSLHCRLNIIAVAVLKRTVFKPAADYGCADNRDSSFTAGLLHIKAQVIHVRGERFGMPLLIGFLVVVAELDNQPVSRFHAVVNRFPQAFI